MSHPIPGHDYSEKSYPSDSPHKEGGHYTPKKKLNKNQKMTGKWLSQAGDSLRKKGESPLGHLKRLTSSPRTKALEKKKKREDDYDMSGATTNDR